MEEVSEYFTIRLRLGNQILPPITIKRSEELIYRNAEKLINERLGQYATRYPGQENITYLNMAILDIAVALKREETRNDTVPFVNSMKKMLDDINETLSHNTQKNNIQ